MADIIVAQNGKDSVGFLHRRMGSHSAQETTSNGHPRTYDLGLKVGILPVGPLNASADAAGVKFAQTTSKIPSAASMS